ncbi:phasin family protein [Pleionea sediminis]|uniref:phasin family protein n=1 Tax=Pleionea sediminis TaxID=2569479 RepID=UPI00118506C1|nr:phasin family protein [Pleionea sediminis]
MFAQAISSFNEQSKAFVEPLLEFNQLALSQAQKLGEKQLELLNEYSKIGLSQLDKAAKIQSIDDFKGIAEEQLKASAELSEKVMKDAQSMISVGQEMSIEWKDFMEKRLSTFSAPVKSKAVKK